MSSPLLLDEMFSDTIAQQLRAKGHDVTAVVADTSLVSMPDDQILTHAAAIGRALVTANIKDFMPLDSQYRAAGQTHPGPILVSTKTFPQDRSYTSAVAAARPTRPYPTDERRKKRSKPGRRLRLPGVSPALTR